jgi:hypothetical protein
MMGQSGAVRIVVVATVGWLAALLMSGRVLPAAGAPRPPSEAWVVTAFVQSTLAVRVLALDAALDTANKQVREHLSGREDDATLAATLHAQARVLTAISHAATALPPELDAPETQQMACVVEDLALVAGQLVGLMEETATALEQEPALEANGAAIAVDATGSAAYAPRVRGALAILRRAEGWLVTIDHETGAAVTLPGFGPGALSLDQQLSLP